MKLFLQQSNIINFTPRRMERDKERARQRAERLNQQFNRMMRTVRQPEPRVWLVEVNPKEN